MNNKIINYRQIILLSSFLSIVLLFPFFAQGQEIWTCSKTGFEYPNNQILCELDCTAVGGVCSSSLNSSSPPPPVIPPTSGGGTGSGSGGGTQLQLYNPIQPISSFAGLVEAIFRAIVIIAIPLTVIFLIWAGVLFVTAKGNDEQIKKAKKVFFWSVLGAMIIVASWVIAVGIHNSAQNL